MALYDRKGKADSSGHSGIEAGSQKTSYGLSLRQWGYPSTAGCDSEVESVETE